MGERPHHPIHQEVLHYMKVEKQHLSFMAKVWFMKPHNEQRKSSSEIYLDWIERIKNE